MSSRQISVLPKGGFFEYLQYLRGYRPPPLMTRVALGTHSSSTPGACRAVALGRIFLDTCSQVPRNGLSSAFGDEHPVTVQPFWASTAVPTGLPGVGGFWDTLLSLDWPYWPCHPHARASEHHRLSGFAEDVSHLLFPLSSYSFCFNFRRSLRSLKTLRLTYPPPRVRRAHAAKKI